MSLDCLSLSYLGAIRVLLNFLFRYKHKMRSGCKMMGEFCSPIASQCLRRAQSHGGYRGQRTRYQAEREH
jgi:hypothetical protein